MDIFTTEVAQRDFLCAKIVNNDQIYISSATPFGRVMTFNFAPGLKRGRTMYGSLHIQSNRSTVAPTFARVSLTGASRPDINRERSAT